MHRHRPRLVKSLRLRLASYSTSAATPPPARQPTDINGKKPFRTRSNRAQSPSTSRRSTEGDDGTSSSTKDIPKTSYQGAGTVWEEFGEIFQRSTEDLIASTRETAKPPTKRARHDWKNTSHSGGKKATPQTLRDIMNPLNKILDAAARKPVNGWHQSNEGRNTAQMRLRQALHRAGKPGSPTKVGFDASEDNPSGTSVLDEEGEEGPELKPGTFVEVRRKSYSTHGVVLSERLVNQRWTAVTLTTSGELWIHKREDVSFTIPNFISQDLAARCDDKEAFKEDIQHAARVQAIKAIREFELSFESVYNDVGTRMRGIYAKVRSTNPNLWTRTTVAEVMKLLKLPSGSVSSPILASLAVHKHLMARNSEFIAAFEKGAGAFEVRPQVQAKAIGLVTEMNRTDDPALKSFIEKAKRIFALSRPAAKESSSEPPSVHEITDKTLEFNDKDRIIIQFLIDSLRLRRRAQDDPYASVASIILKKLGLEVDFFDDTGVRKVLSELGILAPWQDLHSLFAVETEFESAPLTEMHPLPRAYADTLDADGLYKHDVMDSMRHDFGDLPVYIIDDVTAEELDDGVSVERIPSEPENVWVHVHVADPSAILPPHHQLAVKARQRGTTRYWIDHSVPMLPERIAIDGSMGRSQGLPERVMTFSCKLDSKANIIDYKVRPAIVRNTHKLQYDATDAAMGGWQPVSWYPFGGAPLPPSPAKLSPSTLDDLRLIDSIAERMVQYRLSLPTFMYAQPIARPTIQNTPIPLPSSNVQAEAPMLYRGFPSLLYKVDFFPLVERGSRRIVAECMKLAGRVASRFCRGRGIPMLRRMGGPIMAPSEEDFSELLASKDAQGYVDIEKCITANVLPSKSGYTLDPAAHWALGVPEGEGYIRVTSPLRRYLDLVVHWQIKHAMLHPTAKPFFSAEALADLGRLTEIQEKTIRNEDRKHYQTWALFFLRQWAEGRGKNRSLVDNDPLQNLVAQVMHPPVFNLLANAKDCKTYLSDLGLPAMLSNAASRKDTLEPGSLLTNIEVENIKLGQPAQLVLRYRR